MEKKKITWMKYAFGALLLLLGLIFNLADIGKADFFGYGSVGTFLIFCGFLIFVVILLRSLRKNKEAPDERAMLVALKANRLTFVFLIMAAFIIMVIDGITPIEIAYSTFMSYFICVILLFYVISYKVMLKYN